MSEAGTCTVCSAPCSLCMHYKTESGFSNNQSVRAEADSSSVVNVDEMPILKSRRRDKLQRAANETNNLLSTSSSQDSYSENAKIKANLRESEASDTSDDVDMPQGKVVEDKQYFKRNTDRYQFNLHSDTQSHRFPLGKGDGQSGLECHDDNILCISVSGNSDAIVCGSIIDIEEKGMEYRNKSISSFAVGNKNTISDEAGDGNQGHETAERQCISDRSNTTVDSSLLHNCCNLVSVNNVPCAKSQLPSHINDVSQITFPLSSHPEYANSSFLKGESMVIEGNLNLQPEAEVIKCVEKDELNSLASSAYGNSPEYESSNFQKHEDSAEKIGIKGGLSSGTSQIDGLLQVTESGTDCEKLCDNYSDSDHLNDLLERDGSLLAAAKDEDQNMQQAITVDENYESEVALDDVKVCDICGDAGREDLLAICSSCSDGAEHTYCMREMLDKVPEGNWLCEDCKIKDIENQNVDECEEVRERLKSSCLIDINQNYLSTSIPKQAHKLDSRPTDLNARGSVKGLQGPHFSIKGPVDPLEEGKTSELSGTSAGRASPRKRPTLCRQISSKNQDMGKVKAAIMETSSENQPAKSSDAFTRPRTYLSSNSFKDLAPLYSPRGHFSRSVSFNNSNVNHNSKTLIENVSSKQKSVREPATNDLIKDSLFNSSTKSTSKNTASGFSNTETASKKPSLQQSRVEDLRSLIEVKERYTVEKKRFSAIGSSSLRPTAAIASSYPLKADARSAELQSDGKPNSSTKTSVTYSSEGLDTDDLGSKEGKKPVLYSSKCIESCNENYNADNPKRSKVNKEGIRWNNTVDGSHRKFEIASWHSAVQSLESGYKGSRIRDSTTSTGSRLSALGGDKSFHSQRVNDTEGVTHHSSMDKLGGSAHKTLAEHKLRVVDKKGNKWREMVIAAMSKSELNCDKLDIPEELPVARVDINSKAASKHTLSSLNQRSFLTERNSGEVSSNDSAEVPVSASSSVCSLKSDVLPVEVSYKANCIRDTSTATELCAKSLTETVRGEPFLSANQLSGSAVLKPLHLACPLSVTAVPKSPLFENPLSGIAVPKLECIWQGNFNVIGAGSHPKFFFGIQAHLSNCASHRVFQVATKAPGNIQFEEVSHISSCPLQLLRDGLQEENIALFFFAKDIESYEKSYRKLMDKMQRNDLALKGNIDGDELLIFTSNKLPMNSQRWNQMHYLWGMFRGKKRYFWPMMDDKESLSNKDFSLPPIAHVSNEQNLESVQPKKLSDSKASKGKLGESINGVILQTIPYNNEDKTGRKPLASSTQNLLNHMPADLKVPQEQPSFPVGSSSGTKVDPLRAIIDSPSLSLEISTIKACSEEEKVEKNNGTCQGKIVSDCTDRKASDSLAPTYEICVESGISSLRKASSTPSISSNCIKGTECINIKEENEEEEMLPTVMAMIDDDRRGNVLGSDLVSCESTTNRKRGRPCSIEAMLQSPCEMSKGAVETAVLSVEKPSSWLSVEDEREKICHPCAPTNINNNVSPQLTSKAHPMHSSNLRHPQPGESTCSEALIPDDRSPERFFFPLGLRPMQNTKSTNIIDILSDDDDAPESSSPDLELALGGRNKSTKPFVLPSLFHSVDGGKQQRQPDSSGDGDDASASLSLSLFSFSAPDKERSAT